MKHERARTCLTAWGLSVLVGLGGLGCLVTAFSLPLEHPYGVLCLCALGAGAFSLLFLWKNGDVATLCLLCAAVGYCWYSAEFLRQLTVLIVHAANIWGRVYHWGSFVAPEGTPYVDGPAVAIGMCLILTACRSVSSRRGAGIPISLGLLILVLCMAVPDTAPGTVPLLLLLTGMAVLALTSHVRRESAFQGSRLTAQIMLPVGAVFALLLLAMPRSGYVDHSQTIRTAILSRIQQLSASGQEVRAGSRSRPKVDLSALEGQDGASLPVMEVLSSQTGTLYLRSQSYEVYTGTGWEAVGDNFEEFSGWGGEPETITIRTFSPHEVLYLPYFPEGTTQLSQGMVRNSQQLLQYTVTRRPMGSTATTDTLLQYLAQPAETTDALRAYLPAERMETAALAAYIAQLVRTSAVYNRATGRMPETETDFVLWFLSGQETGYCVHFASAAVALLRAAGVPARYVTGYLVRTQADLTVSVTSRNAHAWAEYFDTERGSWQILEATPPEGLTAEPAPTAPPLTEPTAPTARVPMATAPAQSTPEETQPERGFSAWWLLAAALLFGAVWFQRCLRIVLRRWHQRRGSQNRQALRLWRETELLARLLGEHPPEKLSQLAQKALFSQYTLTAEELEPFYAYHSRCRRRLRRRPWYVRLFARYVYAAY